MKKTWIYLLSVILSIVFGSAYFYIFTSTTNSSDQDSVISKDDEQYTIYYNQLGVYKNASAMLSKVEELKANDISVYSFKRNELNFFVASFSFDENITKSQALTLELYGYPTILKSMELDATTKQLFDENKIDDALQMLSN